MDLLGDYNSDSDSNSGSDENKSAKFPSAASVAATTIVKTETRTKEIRATQDIKTRSMASTTTATKSKTDKKRGVIGKKLLKLSAVLPEHILNKLQLSGGVIKEKNRKFNDNDYDSSSDDSSDGDYDNPSCRKKTTTPIAASSRDYSKDEGLMGLLNELSKSKSSSKKNPPTKVLGSDAIFSPTIGGHDDEPTTPLSQPLKKEQEARSVTSSEPLGASFLTTTVETTKRNRKEPTTARIIHDNRSDRQIDYRKEDKTVAETAYKHTSNQIFTVPRSSSSTIAPPQRIKPTSSLRLAAPPVSAPSKTYSSHKLEAYAQVASQHSRGSKQAEKNGRNDQICNQNYQDEKIINPMGEGMRMKKKKKLSRKRQIEEMLRAGKLDEVQGDHELEGEAHVYKYDGDHAGSATSMMSSSSDEVRVRVVPTGSYDASSGATSLSTDVTSRQKNSNQLNSLLANAASLQSHRAQNPQFHLMGVKGKSGSHRATAKRKYGW